MNGIRINSSKALKIDIVDILEYIAAFLFMLNCNSVYQRLAYTDLHIDSALVIILFLLMIIASKGIVTESAARVLLPTLLLLIFYFIGTINKSSKMEFILQFFVAFPCLIIYIFNRRKNGKEFELYRKFSNIVFMISALSTVTWFLTEIIPILTTNISLTVSWGSIHDIRGTFGLFFECQQDGTYGYDFFYQNTGIFCEAPMHSLVLSLSLIYEMFLADKFSWKKSIAICMFIVTTLSSTGFIIIIICFIMKYWTALKKAGRQVQILCLTGLAVILPTVYYISQFMFASKSSTGSFAVRMIDYVAGFETWIHNPIFGIGYNKLSGIYVYKSPLLAAAGIYKTSVGFSNSITAILAQGGGNIIWPVYVSFLALVGHIQKERKKTIQELGNSISCIIYTDYIPCKIHHDIYPCIGLRDVCKNIGRLINQNKKFRYLSYYHTEKNVQMMRLGGVE